MKSLLIGRSCMGSVAVACVGCFAGPGAADVVTRTIAVSGAPAGPQVRFDEFDGLTINDAGRVLLWARLATGGVVNDECAGAIAIGEGGTFISNVGATDSSPPPPGCTMFSDVWFTHTPSVTGTVTVGITGVNFVPTISVLAGECGSLTLVRCQGIGFDFAGVAGTPYYIRVGAPTTAPEGPLRAGTGVLTIRPLTTPAYPFITSSSTDAALFSDRGAPGVLEMILREGPMTAFDPTRTYSSLSFPAFANDGTVAVTGATQGTDPRQITLASLFTLAADSTVVRLEFEAEAPPPGGEGGVERWTLPPPTIADTGDVAYALLDGSLLRHASASVAAGSAAPGTPEGTNFLFLDQPVLASTGAVAFRSTLARQGGGVDDTNNFGLWIDRDGDGNGALELLVRIGTQAPGTPVGVNFASVAIEPGINDDAETVFWASLTGPGVDATNGTGLWTDRSGSMMLLARAGDIAPSTVEGTFIGSLSRRPVMNSRGDVAVLMYTTGPGVSAATNSGIWFYSAGGRAYAAAAEGVSAPGAPEGVLYASFSDPVLNDRGEIAFVARLRGPVGGGITQANNAALYVVGVDGVPVQMVRTGDSFPVGPSDSREVREISLGTAPAGSGRTSLNGAGTVVFQLFFTDYSSGVFAADRTCEADFNDDGVVDSGDFFDFLAAFLVSDPAADFNRSGAVTSQDFFNYLAAFFGGCA